jgi:murein DD-endopeptidase MepM/ murein hydrolase activator NlpD
MESLAHLGLGEFALRIGSNVLTVLLVMAVALLMQNLYRQAHLGWLPNAAAATAEPTADPAEIQPELPALASMALDGIGRASEFHTTIPDRPRLDVSQYTVEQGDNVFSIAEKYGLKPSTILMGNYLTLKNDVDLIRPGQVLNILPVDGAYYQWNETDSLATVAHFYGVEPQVILDSPANHLDPATLVDPAHPNIAGGTWLVIPGGMIQFTWHAPIGVPRNGGTVHTKVTGEGACGEIGGGNVGFGTFVFPTVEHWLSGTDYRPDVGHYGVDFAGAQGNAVYATDAGVVVYSGWNTWGYGNVVVVDHGNGWQSLYAHLSQINVGCAQSVGQGEVVGLIGMTGGTSTGPHLHFELSYNMAPVNPHTVLDIPGR